MVISYNSQVKDAEASPTKPATGNRSAKLSVKARERVWKNIEKTLDNMVNAVNKKDRKSLGG